MYVYSSTRLPYPPIRILFKDLGSKPNSFRKKFHIPSTTRDTKSQDGFTWQCYRSKSQEIQKKCNYCIIISWGFSTFFFFFSHNQFWVRNKLLGKFWSGKIVIAELKGHFHIRPTVWLAKRLIFQREPEENDSFWPLSTQLQVIAYTVWGFPPPL